MMRIAKSITLKPWLERFVNMLLRLSFESAAILGNKQSSAYIILLITPLINMIILSAYCIIIDIRLRCEVNGNLWCKWIDCGW